MIEAIRGRLSLRRNSTLQEWMTEQYSPCRAEMRISAMPITQFG
jgi:hypothetical protein